MTVLIKSCFVHEHEGLVPYNSEVLCRVCPLLSSRGSQKPNRRDKQDVDNKAENYIYIYMKYYKLFLYHYCRPCLHRRAGHLDVVHIEHPALWYSEFCFVLISFISFTSCDLITLLSSCPTSALCEQSFWLHV